MVTTKLIAMLLLFPVVFGCKALSRFTHAGGTEFRVQVSTDEANKDDIMARATKLIQAKASAVSLDVDVARASDAADVLIVKYYGDQPLDPIRNTLLTVSRLEMKKVTNGTKATTPYKSLESANSDLKDDQQVLPTKPTSSTDQPGFMIVESRSVINGDDIRDASAIKQGVVDYAIQFSLKPDSAVKFKDWSGRNIGNYLAIVLNDEILSAPVIKGEMSDSVIIQGRFTKTAAEDLALSLNAGYLPATMTIIDEKPFGK
jgi:preprotein translocase subunit SecD